MGRDKLSEVSCVFIVLSFTALFGASLCQSEWEVLWANWSQLAVTVFVWFVYPVEHSVSWSFLSSFFTVAFTLHPRNVTTLYDRTVVFACSYTTTTFKPQWLIVAEGAFGSTQTLSYPASQGLYSYQTATRIQAQVSVRALRGTPGLNNTCFSCRFIDFGIVASGRGCLIIACEWQLIAVGNMLWSYRCAWL